MYTFITTFYNESESIARFLETLIKQDPRVNEYILVDGGSEDGTIDLVNQVILDNPMVNIRFIIDDRYRLSSIPGPVAAGRNRAISEATGKIILVSDAGCELDKNWAKRIIDRFESDKDISVLGGKCLMKDDFNTNIFLNNKTNNPSSRNLAFKKSVWSAVGGYPQDFLTGEDTMFNQKILSEGFSIDYEPRAIVSWEGPKSPKEYIKKNMGYGKGDGYFGLFRLRFLCRFIVLLFPINYIVKGNFFWRYIGGFYYQIGYIKGCVTRFRS